MHTRLLTSFILLLIFPVLAGAQPASEPVWHALTSGNGEFSVTVPTEYIVYDHKVLSEVRVAGRHGGAFFDTTFRKTGDGNKMLEWLQLTPSMKGEETDFTVGDARVHTHRLRTEQGSRFSIYVATRKGYYIVSTTSSSADNAVFGAILASMKLNGQPLLKDTKAQAPVAAATVKVSSLKTSEVFRAAMQRKQTEKIVVGTGVLDGTPRDRDTLYSRTLMVLQKPHPKFSEAGRNNNISGTIRLRILFKANGNIGRITVLNGLPYGLTEEAISAAKQIKFLPAEINGVPADAEATLEYSFMIY